jgi:hypothetical protein
MDIVDNDRGRLMQDLSLSFGATAQRYAQQLQATIQNPRQWDPGFGITYRKNGQVVYGSYRNIVDEGNLANSQQHVVKKFRALYWWTGNGVTPAVLVHDGWTTTTGKKIPARRWTVEAAQGLNIPNQFSVEFRRRRNG